MASCMECTHFNPCNSHGKIIVEKPTEGNDWGLHNNVENECKYFTPTADVVEVRRGEWTKVEVTGNGYGQIYYQHKNCIVNSTELYKSAYEYCPRCGAKMDGTPKERGGEK